MDLGADAIPMDDMAPVHFPPVINGELVNRHNNAAGNNNQVPNQNENAEGGHGNRREPVCPDECFMTTGFWIIVFIVSVGFGLFVVLIALKMLGYY